MHRRVQKLLFNFLIFASGNFGSKILVFLLLPLYTSVLSTSEYGEIELISTTVSLLLPIITLGINDAVFRFIMSKAYNDSDVIKIGVRIPCVSYSVCLVICIIINIFLKWQYMIGMLILLLGHMIYELVLVYTKAMGKSKTYAFIGIIQTALLLILNIVFLVVFSLGIFGYLCAYCLSFFIPGVLFTLVYRLYEPALCKGSIRALNNLTREMLRYSLPLILNTISWIIIMSSDRYMIRWLIGQDSVGIYSIAAKIPIILQTIITIFTTVWEISSNDIYENDISVMASFYEKGTKYYSAIGYSVGSFLILVCPYLMRFLAKGDFYQGWIYAPMLIISVVFSTAGGINGAIYSAFKDNKGALLSTLYGAFLNLILNYIGITYIGIQGATISTAICRMIISLYRAKDTEKFLKFNRSYIHVIICSGLIIFQAVMSIYFSTFYIIQLLILGVIIAINYKSFIDLFHMILLVFKMRCEESDA